MYINYVHPTEKIWPNIQEQKGTKYAMVGWQTHNPITDVQQKWCFQHKPPPFIQVTQIWVHIMTSAKYQTTHIIRAIGIPNQILQPPPRKSSQQWYTTLNDQHTTAKSWLSNQAVSRLQWPGDRCLEVPLATPGEQFQVEVEAFDELGRPTATILRISEQNVSKIPMWNVLNLAYFDKTFCTLMFSGCSKLQVQPSSVDIWSNQRL